MKTNEELQREVQDAIKWEPLLNAAQIGVTAQDGIVTLSGVVDSYVKKLEAERAAKNVAGVKAVVEKIEINYNHSLRKTNTEIANDVLTSLKSNWAVPDKNIKIKIENGWVTLEGNVSWNYQKEAAKNSVTYIDGVKGITNNIKIVSDFSDKIEKRNIEKALDRHWAINKNDIDVEVSDDKVILQGKVGSWYQKNEVSRLAWNTPGVCSVKNELVVDYDYSYA